MPSCNTCGGSRRWTSTTEDSPETPVDLGPCPDCCPSCGESLMWDQGEAMRYCPNDWEHG